MPQPKLRSETLMTLSIAPSIASETVVSRTPVVLIVDDHAPSLERLKELMEHFGYACMTAGSAVDALIYCDQNRPALVITDFSMPRLNGDGLARWLKARYPTTPILLITGEIISPDFEDSLGSNFAGVIQKPLQVEPFLALIESVLRD